MCACTYAGTASVEVGSDHQSVLVTDHAPAESRPTAPECLPRLRRHRLLIPQIEAMAKMAQLEDSSPMDISDAAFGSPI